MARPHITSSGFDTGAGRFGRQLTDPDDRTVPPQTGTFVLADNPIADPTTLTRERAASGPVSGDSGS